jgi:hypothetical protein
MNNLSIVEVQSGLFIEVETGTETSIYNQTLLEIESGNTVNLPNINLEITTDNIIKNITIDDLPNNIPITKIIGNLDVGRISGLSDFLDSYVFDCGTP